MGRRTGCLEYAHDFHDAAQRRFRRRDPEAAKSIAGPLREYAKRLRAVRDHPESWKYEYDRIYGHS